MDCGLDKNLIQESLDQSLGQLENMLLQEHLKSCESCREEYDKMAALFEALDSLKEDVEIPDGLYALRNQVLSGLEELDSDGHFGIREFLKVHEAAFKGAGRFTEFVPGMALGTKYIKKGIKKMPHAVYKAVGFALKGGMKLMAARART